MKNIFKKAIVLSMMLVTVLVAGCKNHDLTSKEALDISKQYLVAIETLQNSIKTDYVYPLADAQAAAETVNDTDRSKVNILYSEYLDFDFTTSARPETGGSVGGTLFAPKTLYFMSIDLIYQFKDYVDCLTEDNFELDKDYKYYDADLERYEYFKFTVDDDFIYIYVRIDNSHTVYTIDTNGKRWTSIERRSVTIEDDNEKSFYNYYYLERATNENRLFNRNSVVTWTVDSTADHRDQIRTYDLNEVNQKMFFFDSPFDPTTEQGVAKDLHNFMLTIDFDSFVNAINIETAVAVNSAE